MTLSPYIVVAVTFVAAVTDVGGRKVPNWLTYSAGAVGVTLGTFFESAGLMTRLGGLLGALVLSAMLRKLCDLGAGDVKLMAAVGALRGFPFVFYSAFYIVLAGGVIALCILVFRGRLLAGVTRVFSSAVGGVGFQAKSSADRVPYMTMPFAPAIFLGVAYGVYLESLYGPFTIL